MSGAKNEFIKTGFWRQSVTSFCLSSTSRQKTHVAKKLECGHPLKSTKGLFCTTLTEKLGVFSQKELVFNLNFNNFLEKFSNSDNF
jgi:hypothetical protein